MIDRKRILMVASENDALPGTKVGGIGDVMRDLPLALNDIGVDVDTVIPSYGFLARVEKLEGIGFVTIKFSGKLFDIEIFRLAGAVDHYIFHHEMFYKYGEQVYNDDGADRPFAKDASKYAFFCSCVAQAMVEGILPRPDVIHCHDWHSAYLLILIQYGYEYAALRDIKTVYTIHNLALQGIRPFSGDPSSFNTWFPDLRYSVDKLTDPRYEDCANPMRAAILLADYVHTVSPSYAQEMLSESNHAVGIYGGEGLENELKERADQGRVVGILNGCEYPEAARSSEISNTSLAKLMLASVHRWAAKKPVLSTSHWLAEKSISRWHAKKNKGLMVTSVGRVTEQKMRILQAPVDNGKSALASIMSSLGKNDVLVILGSGDVDIETFICQVSAEHPNLIFLNGYSDELSQYLYRDGDMFLMPSSFEPCGISQMLAMRAGQPCIVNAVGGLRDTVSHMETGFVFSGGTLEEQARSLVQCFNETLSLFKKNQETWAEIKSAASRQRFTWSSAAGKYLTFLYGDS